MGEVLHILLGEGADDGSVEHPAHDARGVLDRFTAAKLDVVGAQEEGVAAEFPDADFEADAGARGGFAEDQPPTLVFEGVLGMAAPGGLEGLGQGEDFGDVGGREGFEGKQVLHGW